jgi:hypothetical protein
MHRASLGGAPSEDPQTAVAETATGRAASAAAPPPLLPNINAQHGMSDGGDQEMAPMSENSG